MSDHVSLSVDQLSQSGKRAGLEAGDQAGSSELGAEAAGTSGFEMPSSTEAGIMENSGRLALTSSKEIETHLMHVSRCYDFEAKKVGLNVKSEEYPSCTSEVSGAEDVVNEEAVPLLKGDNGSVIESGSHLGKKDVESPTFAECRICQEEDDIANLESPCACSGSLKFAHRKCIQHWCNEKGDTLCEICQKPFEGGYATPHQGRAENLVLDMGAGWDIASGQPRLFTLASDHHFLEGDYDEYAGSHAHSAACFRSVALILVALLLLRHIISMTGVGGEDEDLTTFFMLSLVRAAGFLIPCYIMARAMNALQIRRQQQEAAIAAAAEVTHLIHSGRIQAVVTAEP